MKTKKKVILGSLFAAIVLLTTSCGGQAYDLPPDTNMVKGPGNCAGNGSGNGSGNGPGASPESQQSPRPTPSSDVPIITSSFTIRGTAGESNKIKFNDPISFTIPNVFTDSVLKIGFKADPNLRAQFADNSGRYTGCQIYSSCLQVSVQLIDHTTQKSIGMEQTISANTTSADGNGPCGKSAKASPVLNLSNLLNPGHGPVDIKIQKALSAVYYNSCAGGDLANTDLKILYFTWSEQGTAAIYTNNAR